LSVDPGRSIPRAGLSGIVQAGFFGFFGFGGRFGVLSPIDLSSVTT
jgi:hypothetical protein